MPQARAQASVGQRPGLRIVQLVTQLVNKALLKGKNRRPSALFMVRLSSRQDRYRSGDHPQAGSQQCVKPGLQPSRVGGATYQGACRGAAPPTGRPRWRCAGSSATRGNAVRRR